MVELRVLSVDLIDHIDEVVYVFTTSVANIRAAVYIVTAGGRCVVTPESSSSAMIFVK